MSSDIEFSDGMKFNTSRKLYSLTCRSDGWYVVGKGMLCAVNSVEEGRQFIEELNDIERMRSAGDRSSHLDNQEGEILAGAKKEKA